MTLMRVNSGRIHESLRDRDGRDAARLRDGDLSVVADQAGLQEVLRHLGALARPGLADHDHHLPMSEVNTFFKDWFPSLLHKFFNSNLSNHEIQ